MSALPFREWPLPSQVFVLSLGCGIVSQLMLNRDLRGAKALPAWTFWESNVGHLRRCLKAHRELFSRSPLRILCMTSLTLCAISLLFQIAVGLMNS